MTRIAKCDVCGAPIRQTEYTDEGQLMEASEKCHICGYSYRYAYGHTEIVVNGKVFEFSYDTPPDSVRLIEAEIDKEIELYRLQRKK